MSVQLRNEKKYILNNNKYNQFLKWLLSGTFMKKKYINRHVNSLYIDDLENTSVKDNLIGISNRSKKRFRWYSENNFTSAVSFEEKIKTGKLGYKKKFKLNSQIVDNVPIKELINKFIRELEGNKHFFQKYFIPTLYVSYERSYYEDVNGARVTLDSNICYGHINQFSTLKNIKKYSYDYVIAEIKYNDKHSDFTNTSLRDLELIPQRHSKYLVGRAILGDANYL
jgi:hypothetical protein